MRALRPLFLLLFSLVTTASAALVPLDAFRFAPEQGSAERIEELMEGADHVCIPLDSYENLELRIDVETPLWPMCARVSLHDTKAGIDGIELMVPVSDKSPLSVSYLATVEGTANFRGNQLLSVADELYNWLAIDRVLLIDAAGVDSSIDEDLHLRLYRCLTRDEPLGWYESRGYAPVDLESSADILSGLFSAYGFDLSGVATALRGPDANAACFVCHELWEASPELYALAKRVVRAATLESLMQDLPVDESCPALRVLEELAELIDVQESLGCAWAKLELTHPSLYADTWTELLCARHATGRPIGAVFFEQSQDPGERELLARCMLQVVLGNFPGLYEEDCTLSQGFKLLEALLSNSEEISGELVEEDWDFPWLGELEAEQLREAMHLLLSRSDRQEMSAAEQARYLVLELRGSASELMGAMSVYLESGQERPSLLQLQMAIGIILSKSYFMRDLGCRESLAAA